MSEGPTTPGRAYLEAIRDGRAAAPPFSSALNMRLTEIGDGMTAFEMPVTPELYNPNDVVHGGAITALVDSAMGLAMLSTLEEGESFTTAAISVNFLRSVTVNSSPLRCVGRVIHRGRQTGVTEGEVFDRTDQLVARATATHVIFAPRPQPPALAPAPEPTPVAAFPPPPPPVPVPAQPFLAPPSRLEHRPSVSTPPGGDQAPIAPAPLALTKQRIRLFAGDMGYLRRGEGPPVILIHGVPSSSYLWRDVIDPLAARFDVIAPDLVGYGDSDKRLDADLSVRAQARYLVAFLEALQVYQAAVIGHDIGGGIAQLIAADEPGRVARLVLVDSVVDNNWPVPDIARLKDPAWDQIMVTLDLHKGFRKALDTGIVTEGRVTDEVLDEFVRPFADLDGRRAYLRAARALDNRDLLSRAQHVREIDTPTLILWGANDRFLDPQWAEELHRKLRRSTVQVIDPGGHFLPLDRPDAVSEALLQFLTA